MPASIESDYSRCWDDSAGALRRRLFAQEFTTRLQRIGTATITQMESDPDLVLFKIKPTGPELRTVAEIARRFGWVEEPAALDGEWRLTDRGAALARPTSLAEAQVFSRLTRAADPVRTQAEHWLPTAGVLGGGIAVGGISAFAKGGHEGAIVKTLAIALLTSVLAAQVAGEAQIVAAVRGWPRLKEAEPRAAHRAVLGFYSYWRLALNVVFLCAVVAAVGLGLFNQTWPFVVAAATAAVIGVVLAVVSLRAEAQAGAATTRPE